MGGSIAILVHARVNCREHLNLPDLRAKSVVSPQSDRITAKVEANYSLVAY